MTEVHGGARVCRQCLENGYKRCADCETYFPNAGLSNVDKHGESVYVCDNCLHTHYDECLECSGCFHESTIKDGLCPDCKKKAECDAA